MQAAVRNFLLAAGLLAVAIFYYWMNWSAEVPILGGDHAVYLLTADHMSPFSDRGYDVTRAAMSYSYFPPLYPLILGITGGTSAHVEIAHAVAANQVGYPLASVIIGLTVVNNHSEALNSVV